MKTCYQCKRESLEGVLTCPYCGHLFPTPGLTTVPIAPDRVTIEVPADEVRADNPHLFRKDHDDQRRLKVVWVPEQFVFQAVFLRGVEEGRAYVLVESPPLPDGYELIPGAHHDFTRRAFVFYVRHPSFDVVPDGCPAPDFAGTMAWQWKLVEVKKSSDNPAVIEGWMELVVETDTGAGTRRHVFPGGTVPRWPPPDVLDRAHALVEWAAKSLAEECGAGDVVGAVVEDVLTLSDKVYSEPDRKWVDRVERRVRGLVTDEVRAAIRRLRPHAENDE